MRANLKREYRDYPYWRLASMALLQSVYVFPWAIICGAYNGAWDNAGDVWRSLKEILDIRHEDRRKRHAAKWEAFNEQCRLDAIERDAALPPKEPDSE